MLTVKGRTYRHHCICTPTCPLASSRHSTGTRTWDTCAQYVSTAACAPGRTDHQGVPHRVGASITTLLGQHAPDSLLLKNIPATAQPLFPSVDVDWPSDPPQAASDTGQQLQPPSTASPDQPSRRGRGAGVALEAGRVNVRFEDVPEYVLFAMITKQVEARVPVEELRSLDPKRRRQLRSVPEVTVATPDSHTAAEPTPPDAWGDGMAASNDSEEPPAAAAGGDVVGDAVAGAGGGGAMERRRMRTLPPPPTAEELARREEEAAWGWSEAGEAAERPAAGTASQRRRQHAAAAEAGGPPNATLADEWTDAFPEDVPRTSDDWSAAEEGAVRRRGRNREHIGDAVTVLPRAVPASPWL